MASIETLPPWTHKRLMPEKTWNVLSAPPHGLADSTGMPELHARLLHNRGIRRSSEVATYLRADASLAHDPLLLPDMDVAVGMVKSAVAWGTTVGVFGDFDVDGISGTALLTLALRELGVNVVPYLPHRVDEGHGLNVGAIQSLKDHGVSLIITVDCGVTDTEEVAFAGSLGIDTIITDHHTLSEKTPAAAAIVNPRRRVPEYPYPDLTGSGLAYKLVEAVWLSLGRGRPEHLIELAALGTVADVGPITGENRYIVKTGLTKLNRTKNVGLRVLIGRAGLVPGTLDTEALSFSIIPRLNAAGRIGHAQPALKLLTTDKVGEAEKIAESLENNNAKRRNLTTQGLADAQRQVQDGSENIPPIIIVEHVDWLPGVLGLIAGNLSEAYYRPAIAVRVENNVARASCRSIEEFDIIDALKRSDAPFLRYGGHPQAAGFLIPATELPALKAWLLSDAETQLGALHLRPSVDIDCEIMLSSLTDRTVDFISTLGPFGPGNPAPTFLTRDAWILDVRRVGKDHNHLKMRIAHDHSTREAIAFRQSNTVVAPGDRIDLIYNVSRNYWNGEVKTQLTVADFRPVE